jgi:gliding motility-associated-like protein
MKKNYFSLLAKFLMFVFLFSSFSKSYAFRYVGKAGTLPWALGTSWTSNNANLAAFPGANDTAIIPSGSTITINTRDSCLVLSVSGTLNFLSNQTLTIGAGDTLNSAGTINLGGTNNTINTNGYFVANGGTIGRSVWTVSGASTFNGVVTFNNTQGAVAFNGTSVFNNGSGISLTAARIGSATFTFGGAVTTNGTVSLSGTSLNPVIMSSTLTVSGGSTFSISNTSDAIGGAVTVNGTLTFTGSTLATVTMANTLTIAAGATFNIASASLVVSGATTVNGSIVFNDASVPKTFATVTVASTGTWDCSGYNMFFKITGSLTNLGTFNASATTVGPNEYKFTGVGATINGTLTIPHLNVTNPGALTNMGTLTITDSLYGTGTFVQGNGSTLNYNAPNPIVVSTFNAYTVGQTNLVDYGYSGPQTIRGNNSGFQYDSLSCSNSGTKTLGNNIVIQSNLTIQNAASLDVSSVGNYDIKIYGNWTINSSNSTPFVPEMGTVTFEGTTGVQALTTNVLAGQSFYDITFNNTSPASPNITTNANINVTDNTTFTLGNLDLQGHNYVITPGTISTTDNFNAGSIFTSVAGSNFNATDPNKVKMIYFSGTKIGTAAHGITFNVTAGRIQFNNFTEYGTANFTKTLNIDDVFGGGNYYHGPVTFTATTTASRWRMGDNTSAGHAVADTFWNATFIADADSATGGPGSLNNNFIVGANSLGNAFYGTTHMTSITPGGFYVCRDNDSGIASCEFHGPVVASINYTGNMTFANSGLNHANVVVFDSSITLNSTALSTGYYNFANANVYGKVILNPGAQFLTGSINGRTNTYLNNVTQNGPLKQTINTSGSTGALYIGGVTALPAYKCTFNGPCNFTADTAGYFVGSTFNDTTNITVNHPNANGYLISDTFRVASTAIVGDLEIQNNYFGGTVTLQHTSSFNSLSNGGNTFNGNAIVQNQGTGIFRMGDFGGLGDTYYGTINFVQNGGGTTQPAYGLPSYFNGNISVAGSTGTPIAFGTGGGTMVVQSAGGIQTFSNGTAPIPAIGNLTMNTLVAGSVLQFNFSATVSGTLNMIQGIINLNGNTLTLGTSSLTPGTLICPLPPAITGWIFGGTFARWVKGGTTIPLPTATAVATAGFFPMGSNLVQLDFEPLWFAGTIGTGGIISVSQPSTAVGINPITTYTDVTWGGGTPVGDITTAGWKVTTGTTTLGLGTTAKLVYGGFGFEPPYAYPYNSDASDSSTTGTYAAPLQLYASNDIEVERTNLTMTQIASHPWHIGLEIPPAPVAGGNTPVCSGGTINLTASNITGATYTWTGPNGFVSHSQDTSLTNVPTAASGTYSVTATVGTITGPAGTVTIVVNPTPAAPAASSNTPVCTGTTLLLTASNVGSVTYSWTGPNGFSSSLQNPSIANVTLAAAGTYSVMATGTVGGCPSAVSTTTVVVKSTPATPTPTSNSPVCGDSTLKLSTAAVGSATYSWTGPNSFSSALQNPTITNATTLATGTYSLTVKVNGCTSGTGTTPVTVYPPVATPVPASNSPVCTGSTLSLSTSVGGATYSWQGPNGFSSTLQNPSITNVTLAAVGTYSLAIKVSGCPSDTGTTTVVVNPTPATPTPTNNSPICSGDTLNLFTSLVGSATYNWSGPNSFISTAQNPSILNAPLANAGTYSVTVTVNGCTSQAGTTVATVNPTPSVTSVGSNSPVCAGSALNLTANSTGTNYSWTGPNGFSSSLQNPSIANATTAATGTYSVTSINLPSGCTSDTATVSVIVSKLIPILTTISEVKCNGTSTGEAAVSVSGGTTPYTYAWTSGATTDTATGLTAGIYTVTVTDVNGCMSVSIDTITQPTPLVVNTSEAPATCGVNNGSASVTVSGGVPSYTYQWSSGQTVTAVTNIFAGQYYVVVTDSNACFDTSFVTVTNSNGPNPFIRSVTDVSCNGGNNGSVKVGVTGGISPYTFTWMPIGGTDSIGTGLTAGSYTVDVTDANNCLNIATVVITQPSALKDSTISQTNVACNGGDNGRAVLFTKGGVSPYTYLWSNSITTDSASNLTAGKYGITVKDSNGCSVQDTVTILQPAPMIKTITANKNPICYGDSAVLSAGTAPAYLWSTGATTDSITVKPLVTTPYTVYQSNGSCKDTVVDTVIVYSKLGLVMAPVDSICFGNAIQVEAVVSGGKPVYNYAWNNGLANGPGPYSVKPTRAITYLCTVTDGCGATAKDSTVVVGTQGPKAGFYPSSDTAASGQLIAFINTTKGGTAWYWNFGDGSTAVDSFPNHSFAVSGNYQVYLLVTTTGGCVDSVAETLVITAPFMVPNVFTPNGDGINDVFHVKAGAMQSYTLSIFNRWGEVVFSANNPNIDWGGRTNAGLEATTGTYFYKINAVDNEGTAYNLSGTVELIR